MLKGACLCGGVQYEADSDGSVAGYCHCTRCQRVSGGANVPWVLVDPGKISLISGADQVVAYAEEGFGTRHFCKVCGSGVYATGEDWAVVNAGTLKSASDFKPQLHMMVDFKASWHEIVDGLPEFGEHLPE